MNHFKEKIGVLAGALILFVVWQFGYKNYLYENQSESGLDWKLNRSLGEQAAFWFNMTGFEARVYANSTAPHIVSLNHIRVISIDTPCNGIPMMFLYAAFILVYPGSWRRKTWFVLGGLVFLHFLNLCRIIGLSYLSYYAPDFFEFNHKFLFQIVVYSVTISIWLFYILYGSDEKIRIREGIREFFSFKVFNRITQII
jgi:exosortase family protein XrtF